VLIVDDGDTNRDLLTLLLTDSGAHVKTATNGREAVQLLTEQNLPVDVVLMDMQMPVMDGYSATRELRSRGFNRPVIAMTANAMVGDDTRCRESGCSDYLSKPINLDQLLQMVRDWAGNVNARAETDEPSPSAVSNATDTGPAVDHRPTTCEAPVGTAEPAVTEVEPILPGNWLREFACELIDRVNDEIPQMLSACEGGDLPQLARQAHWIKGSGGTVGLHRLSKLALDCETAVHDAQIDKIRETIHEISEFLRDANRERATDLESTGTIDTDRELN
jgi:two-component system sensor kinase